jgi:hypothetical protein
MRRKTAETPKSNKALTERMLFISTSNQALNKRNNQTYDTGNFRNEGGNVPKPLFYFPFLFLAIS